MKTFSQNTKREFKWTTEGERKQVNETRQNEIMNILQKILQNKPVQRQIFAYPIKYKNTSGFFIISGFLILQKIVKVCWK